MEQKTYNPKALERFLLGDLSEDECTQLEDAFLVDSDLFDQLNEAEHDLIDEYVQGNLRGRDLSLFEKHYLKLPRSRERVALAEGLERIRAAERKRVAAARPAQAVVAEEKASLFSSFWRSWGPVLSFSSAAIILASVIGITYLAFRNHEAGGSNQIARNEPQAIPSPQATSEMVSPAGNSEPPVVVPAPVQPRSETPQARPPKAVVSPPAEPTAPVTAPQQNRSLTLALMAGISRGEGEAGNTLKLTPGVSNVNLQVSFNRPELKNFKARIETVEGQRVFSGNIAGVQSGQKQQRGVLTVPARSLPAGDYILTISGTDASGTTSDIEDYYLSVKKEQ